MSSNAKNGFVAVRLITKVVFVSLLVIAAFSTYYYINDYSANVDHSSFVQTLNSLQHSQICAKDLGFVSC
jgi:hypothetical protein